MRVHRLLEVSKANGPGNRFAVWVQGCSRRCCGCFNPDTHDPCGGYEIEVSEIIRQITKAEVSGITVSGGEPFEQAEELLSLLEEAGRIGLNRLVYTGNTYEELLELESGVKCLEAIDILIDGEYKKEQPAELLWTGSGNQRVIELEKGKIRKVYKNSDIELEERVEGEIIIDGSGEVITTGIIDGRVFAGRSGK
jgi:anaerobic ribonucleoside-triphosphate reductase activating protein